MLPHHARSVSTHRTALFRSIGSPSRCLPPRSRLPALSRQYMITRQYRPLRRRSGSDSGLGFPHERRLATAVDDFKLDGIPFNHLPESSMPPFHSASSIPPQGFYAFDPASPLRVPEPGERRPATRTNTYGIPGEAEDMLPMFHACIRVGKLDRASQVLKRLDISGALSGEERILLHNQYLRASLQQMRADPDLKQAEALHKWFELRIHTPDLPRTAETIACMLKASLLSERGSRLDRLVGRYMGMAPGEAGLRVLNMADILSDQDLAVITEICPTYNLAADAETAEEQAELQEEMEEDPGSTTAPFEPTPELISTEQRGEGLKTLKQGLGLLANLQDVDTSKLTDADRHQIQLQIERDSITAAIEKWRHEQKNLSKMGINTALAGSRGEGSLSQVMASWLVDMEARLKEEFKLVDVAERKVEKSDQDLVRCLYGPIIRQADPARLAAVTILSTLSLGAVKIDKGITVSNLVLSTAKLAQEDIQLQQREKAKKQRRKRKVQYVAAPEPTATEGVSKSATTENSTIMTEEDEAGRLKQESEKPWSTQLKSHVGAILTKILVETAKVQTIREHGANKQLLSQTQPAFTHKQIPRRGKKVGVVLLNPSLIEKLKREPMGEFIAKHLPMLVEPRPWKSFSEGGFLESRASFVRLKSADVEQKLYTHAAIQRGDTEMVFKGLDVLGKTAWRVNKSVLNVMMEAWNSGDAIANMPPLHPTMETPPEPDTEADPLQRRLWTKAVKVIENEKSGLHSQRCFMNLQLEVARTFRNQTIYFPHNIDYRGRAYPIPTYLNHMGADHTRALLKFAEGKRLGARGLRWLKIHFANVYGLDKASFDDREAFATEHVAQIIESATNPLNGSRWWLKAEDPWQCLAACFELKAAFELPDPTDYVCTLPVHQDGTCNGLQHYAALGGDSWGARQVNLEPGDKPADVYSAVADLVKEGLAKDAEGNNPFAKLLEGKITRKVVKQTVMTNVYGVTFAGAKKQVLKQLDALYPNLGKDNGLTNILLATYISKHIFNALATMFRGAHDIQYWLGEVGGRVCRALTPAQLDQMAKSYATDAAVEVVKPKKSSGGPPRGAKGLDELTEQFRSTVVWTTPLRLPVAQPYRSSSTKEVRTCMQSVNYPTGDQTDPVNRRKQLQGFPPNFIHSLDASHMLLSALQCHKLGLTFAAVHDSFWTHAADVDVMNGVIRDAFIQIHDEDVVGRLASEFEARHTGSLYLAHIDSKSPVARKIMELRRNSGLTAKEELLLEHKRNTLRLSGSPWDLEAAKQIVTPASVYEDMNAAEEDVDIREQIKDIGLGSIPDSEPVPIDGVTVEGIADLRAQESEADAAESDKSQTGSSNYVQNVLDGMKYSQFESQLMRKKTSTVAGASTPMKIWLPLTIPAIPKKGDFDVSRTRESKYFFS